MRHVIIKTLPLMLTVPAVRGVGSVQRGGGGRDGGTLAPTLTWCGLTVGVAVTVPTKSVTGPRRGYRVMQ